MTEAQKKETEPLTTVQLDMLRGIHFAAMNSNQGDEMQCWAGDVELLAAVRTHLGTLLDDLAAAQGERDEAHRIMTEGAQLLARVRAEAAEAEGRAVEARTRADRAEAELAAIHQKGA